MRFSCPCSILTCCHVNINILHLPSKGWLHNSLQATAKAHDQWTYRLLQTFSRVFWCLQSSGMVGWLSVPISKSLLVCSWLAFNAWWVVTHYSLCEMQYSNDIIFFARFCCCCWVNILRWLQYNFTSQGEFETWNYLHSHVSQTTPAPCLRSCQRNYWMLICHIFDLIFILKLV